jgi:uncharacterized membrane protein YfcA
MLALGDFLLILFGGVGMTNIIVEGEIFVPIKNLLKKFMPKFFMKMMDCHQCCGFWSGIFVSLFVLPPFYANVPLLNLVTGLGQNFACGCAVSMMAVFWANFMLLIESKTVING